eukprot:CAMPEP_0179420536 /NCGR_PEP_ID=MMETSP0799-20121207/9224_1 /TAXON_ID=46947 /ORGANISM="Geminigera cryophila, Strain CCMP2564" /LENGTH=63 /DNA_ID=CAMNT_0021194161 /DNA_START=324 /DNA_END=512 /DNA_ORIENTATION=-
MSSYTVTTWVRSSLCCSSPFPAGSDANSSPAGHAPMCFGGGFIRGLRVVPVWTAGSKRAAASQ